MAIKSLSVVFTTNNSLTGHEPKVSAAHRGKLQDGTGGNSQLPNEGRHCVDGGVAMTIPDTTQKVLQKVMVRFAWERVGPRPLSVDTVCT